MDEIEALIIDIPSLPSKVPTNENSEAFFTLLDFIEKAEKMTINFADRLISHSLIIIDNNLLNHINSANSAYSVSDTNPFAYIVTNQYYFDQFYEIMINIDVFKNLKVDYGQFMA